MKKIVQRCFYWSLLFLVTVSSVSLVFGAEGPTVDEKFPHLATGILKSAVLAKMNEGVVMTAGDTNITAKELEEFLGKVDRKIRKQLKKNLFYVLEERATEKLVAREAYKAGYGKTKRGARVVKAFLQHKFSGIEVADDEAKVFYTENKETVGVPFEQSKNYIKNHLSQKKQEEATKKYIESLGRSSHIEVDTDWVQKQFASVKDNPVDRARDSGKPTMIEFGATGCKSCDMMQPILKSLESKYRDKLNVVFVHVREEQILAARYGITSIPVQVFFDKNGKEFFRHVGFYPQNEVEKRISEMEGVINEKSG